MTVRIVIDDTGRTDTAPLTVDLTANYILIDGHSNLTVLRDGKTDSEDLNGETVYPLIRDSQSSSAIAALSEVGFKTALGGAETLSRVDGDADLLFDATAKEVRVAGGVLRRRGQTLTMNLRATDGDASLEAKARKDRNYAVQVRYLKSLSAKAFDATSGGTEINAVREIRVLEAEKDETHFVAHIEVDGGAGNNAIVVEGDDVCD